MLGVVQVRYRYRIYPSPGQQQALARVFGCARVVYNDCLRLRDDCERARTREVDVAGLRLPDWEQITSREYEPWDRDHLVIDTATRTPAEAVAAILAAIPERAG